MLFLSKQSFFMDCGEFSKTRATMILFVALSTSCGLIPGLEGGSKDSGTSSRGNSASKNSGNNSPNEEEEASQGEASQGEASSKNGDSENGSSNETSPTNNGSNRPMDASMDGSTDGLEGGGGDPSDAATGDGSSAEIGTPCSTMPSVTPPALKRGPAITGFAGQAGQVVGVPGEKTLYVIGHRNGNVYVVQDGKVESTPLLHVDVGTSGESEQGLLSMALHPQFATNHLFYIFFNSPRAAQFVVEEWERTSPTTAEKKRAVYSGQGSGRYHNGGSIYFNPKDTEPLLYHSVGNAETNEAGNPMGVLGRVLRYNVTTGMGVPASTGNVGEFTFAYGLRNPYRMSIDRLTGDMYIGDVANGPGGTIIFNAYGTEGRNFGYLNNNGSPDVNNGLVREGGGAAIIGGVVYRGNKIPGLCGRYFYGLHAGGAIKSFLVQNGRRTGEATHSELTVPGNLSSFGEDGDGEIWMSSMNRNAIYQIQAAGSTNP